jgi:hypothetical protein
MLLSRSCLGFAKAVKPHFSVLSRLSSKQSQTPDSDDDDEGDEDNLIRKEHNTTYKVPSASYALSPLCRDLSKRMFHFTVYG